jgi:AcrR family transcriptional regulator
MLWREKARADFDGRNVRRHRNRQRIVAAMLELVRAGAISPGVGLRTVFRHFADMDSLYREMAEAMRRELEPILAAPFVAQDWEGRIPEIVERRGRLFERAMPFKNAADVHRHRSEFLRKDYEEMRSAERAALEAALPPTLKSDKTLFEALDQALSFATWQHLRRDQKLSPVQARQTIEFVVRALVGASEKSKPAAPVRVRPSA